MNERTDGIAQLRALADALEKEQPITMVIAWMDTGSPTVNIGSMDFGNPFVVDGLTLHLVRTRCRYGEINDGLLSQRIVQ